MYLFSWPCQCKSRNVSGSSHISVNFLVDSKLPIRHCIAMLMQNELVIFSIWWSRLQAEFNVDVFVFHICVDPSCVCVGKSCGQQATV